MESNQPIFVVVGMTLQVEWNEEDEDATRETPTGNVEVELVNPDDSHIRCNLVISGEEADRLGLALNQRIDITLAAEEP